MPMCNNLRFTRLSLGALAVAALLTVDAHAQVLSFSVDLRTGVADAPAPPHIIFEVPPTDTDHDGWYETVLRVNLNDPRYRNPYRVAEFRVEYGARPSGQVNLNIGDSRTNNSNGGDAGTQTSDAEIQIGNMEGQVTDLFVFGKDGSPGLLDRVPGLAGEGVVATFTISDGRVAWRNSRDVSGSRSSPYGG